MRRSLPLQRLPIPAALALAWALTATPAGADRGPALAWPGPEVSAGQVIVLSWGDLPEGVEEMEILLSLDDGRSFPIRVSPELDARERNFRWRVPDLPTGHARLRMRLGDERAEIETEPGASFRIVGAASRAAPRPMFHEGTFWTGFGVPAAAVPDAFAPVTRLENAPHGATATQAPRLSMTPPARAAATTDPVEPRPGVPAPTHRPASGPEFFPQRN